MKFPFLALLLLASFALATPPTTQPASVAVLPFTPLSETSQVANLAPAVQANLVSDLARARLNPTTRPHNARFRVTGNWQTIDQQIRFTAQILDTQSNNEIVGGLVATGPVHDLFSLEDSLSSQAIHRLRQLESPPPTANAQTSRSDIPPLVLVLTPPVDLHQYQGSDLQSYVDSNRTPSTDYWTQYRTSRDNYTYQYNSPWAGYGYYGYGCSPYAYTIGYPIIPTFSYRFSPITYASRRFLPVR